MRSPQNCRSYTKKRIRETHQKTGDTSREGARARARAFAKNKTKKRRVCGLGGVHEDFAFALESRQPRARSVLCVLAKDLDDPDERDAICISFSPHLTQSFQHPARTLESSCRLSHVSLWLSRTLSKKSTKPFTVSSLLTHHHHLQIATLVRRREGPPQRPLCRPPRVRRRKFPARIFCPGAGRGPAFTKIQAPPVPFSQKAKIRTIWIFSNFVLTAVYVWFSILSTKTLEIKTSR